MLAWLYRANAPDLTAVQLLNIASVFVTLDVSNSGTAVKLSQELNI